jgi:periplasmic protein TonB
MLLFRILVLLSINFSIFGQYNKIYKNVDEIAEFPGGQGNLGRFLQKNMNFKVDTNGLCGKVKITFIVEKTGKLKFVKCNENCDSNCNEAKRLIEIMPIWKPAKLNGKIVNSYYFLPINIELE